MLNAETIRCVRGKRGDRVVARPSYAAKRSSISWMFESHNFHEASQGATLLPPLPVIAVKFYSVGWRISDSENVKTSTRDCVVEFAKVFCRWRRGQDSNLQALSGGGFQDRCTTNYATPPWLLGIYRNETGKQKAEGRRQ